MPEIDFSFLAIFGTIIFIAVIIAILATLPWWIWPLIIAGVVIKGVME